MNEILEIPVSAHATYFSSLFPNVVNVELCATAVCAFLKIDMAVSSHQSTTRISSWAPRKNGSTSTPCIPGRAPTWLSQHHVWNVRWRWRNAHHAAV